MTKEKMNKEKKGCSASEKTDRVLFYFRKEVWILLAVTITGILYNVGLAAGPWFEGQLVQCLCDILSRRRDAGDMLKLAACYGAVIAFVQLMRFLKRLYVRKFANNTGKRMKMTIYRNLLHQDLMHRNAHQDEEAGAMMTRILADADACAEGMRKFTTEVFDTGVVMVAYLGMLLTYDVRLTLLSMIFPPAACLLAEKLKVLVTRNAALSRESSARLNSATLERVTHGLTYRLYGRERGCEKAYEADLTDYEKKAVRANIWENAMQPVYQVISMISSVLILWFGAQNVLGNGWVSWDVAAFTTFFACYLKLAVKASKVAKLFNAVQKARVSWNRIRPWLGEPAQDPLLRKICSADLSVRSLTFSFPGQKPLFSQVSFQAEPGEIIGITGEIACGKSTLGKLFLGEFPYEGEILLGGKRLSGDGKASETCTGYLGHQPELFSGTIEENICLGEPGDVWPVLRAVCMEAEVKALPRGIHTVIGSGGVRLSGGQQARIALARTLYFRKPLLVLDDPFSAVDPGTEEAMFSSLRIWGKESVILLISHRLAMFPQMDQVLWMENGRVTAGDHNLLMDTVPQYRRLFEAQRKETDEHEENRKK
ncbi:MAG: ABC transporter ATP-binding protein [Firmicutes bacterium]|nr:ABC transporter ATP-binding protein [Bacillota bacterium]MDY5856737.1 ABC transporter ATP-binding protein [Anaerovoracaceae bacterium]